MISKSFLKSSFCLVACLSLTACEKKFNPSDGAPQSPQTVETGDMSLVTLNKPDLFPLVTADQIEAPAELKVTGTVNPDIAREVPVISLASGRVVDIKARLDDHVKKGDLLLKVQSPDITNAFDAYLKAVNDEQLANKAYVRAQDLYAHGAISLGMLEQAEDTERDAKTDLTAAEEQLNTLGVRKDHPSSIVNVYAPITGVIVAQNVTNAAAAGVTYSGSSTAFTIADLSVVWIICDVYENDIPKLQLGQTARIKIDAYPDKLLTGHISDIGPVLDPSRDTSDGFIPDRNYSSNALASETWLTLAPGTTDILLATSDRPYGANLFYGPYDSWERTKGWFASIQQQFGRQTAASYGYRRHSDLFVLFADQPAIYENNHITTSYEGALRRADSLTPNTTLSYGLEVDGDTIHSNSLGEHARNQGAAMRTSASAR